MKIAFTIGSINFLAQSKALGDSLAASNPEYVFFICLVDKISASGLPEEMLPPYTIIEAEELGMDNWDEIVSKYSIIELNTCVKATFFKMLFGKYKPEHVLFFDPDILVLNSLHKIEESFEQFSIILTPHTSTPIVYEKGLPERAFLNYGVYNLGFIGLKNSPETARLLNWWERKQMNECYIDTYNGLYVDQLWVNLVPAYFNEVYIDKYPGNDVAFWNLHERTVIYNHGNFYINDTSVPLVFFHFSKVNIKTAEIVPGLATTDITAASYDSSGLKILLKKYSDAMYANHYEHLKTYRCYYENIAEKKRKQFLKNNLPKFIKKPLVLFSKKVLGIKTKKY